MFRHDEPGGDPEAPRKRKRVARKGIRMMVGGLEIVSGQPVEDYLRSELAEARAAEALKRKTFLDV